MMQNYTRNKNINHLRVGMLTVFEPNIQGYRNKVLLKNIADSQIMSKQTTNHYMYLIDQTKRSPKFKKYVNSLDRVKVNQLMYCQFGQGFMKSRADEKLLTKERQNLAQPLPFLAPDVCEEHPLAPESGLPNHTHLMHKFKEYFS